MCLRISINLHDIIFRGVSRTKIIFFNNNPSGRILNRFARDINNIDLFVPNIMMDVADVMYQRFICRLSSLCSKNIDSNVNFFHVYFGFSVLPQLFSNHCDECLRECVAADTSWYNDGSVLFDTIGLR